jgi:hypothetical protein
VVAITTAAITATVALGVTGGAVPLGLAIGGIVVVATVSTTALVTVTKVRAHQADASRRADRATNAALLSMPRSSITDDHESLSPRDWLTDVARQQLDVMQHLSNGSIGPSSQLRRPHRVVYSVTEPGNDRDLRLRLSQVTP